MSPDALKIHRAYWPPGVMHGCWSCCPMHPANTVYRSRLAAYNGPDPPKSLTESNSDAASKVVDGDPLGMRPGVRGTSSMRGPGACEPSTAARPGRPRRVG